MDRKANILIVEDERIVAEDLRKNLEILGYDVLDIVSSGEKVLEKLKETLPDLILMDIVLKGAMNGIEASDRIRKDYFVPVVYLTAHADKATLDKAKKTEPYGYLLKPFATGDLHTTIEMALYKFQMEKKLRERETWFATTLQSIVDGVITTDHNGNVKFMNPVAEIHTGWKSDEAFERPLKEIFRIYNEETGEEIENYTTVILNEIHKANILEKMVLKDRYGRITPINSSASPIVDSHNTRVGTVLVFQDITENRKAEEEKQKIREQLLQAQKMEAIGKLAGGIAHDFNTLLTAIMGSTDIAMLNMDTNHEIYDDLNEIQIAASYAADLTRQLLLFSRKHPMNMITLNLNQPIEDMLKLLHRVIGEDVKIKMDLSDDLWSVLADKGTIEQVLMNLAVNAREAMPKGGDLFIKTENLTLDESAVEIMPDARPGRFVCVTMQDTGTGMHADTIEHIFEPFFSTKGPGKGTGLGLSVVYGIIRQHEGWIHVYSEINQGAIFKIFLPAHKKIPVRRGEKKIVIFDIQGQGERILVVEDGKGAREFTRRALSKNGYYVFAAANSEEALKIYEEEEGRFDLIFSDVELPGRTGIDLVDEIHEKNPDLKILMCSGYTDQNTRWPIIEKRGYRFLQKPYGLKDLLRVVRETLKK